MAPQVKKKGGQFKWNNQGNWFPVITSQTTGNSLCMEKCKMAHKWRRDFQFYQLLLHTAMFCLCCLEIVSKPGQVKSIFLKKKLKMAP